MQPRYHSQEQSNVSSSFQPRVLHQRQWLLRKRVGVKLEFDCPGAVSADFQWPDSFAEYIRCELG